MRKEDYDKDYFEDINAQSLEDMCKKYEKFTSYLPKHIKPKMIVDLGCGSGTLCAFLKKKYPESKVVGVDFYEGTLKAARKKYKDIDFLKLNIQKQKYPFKDNSVDLVLAHEVIEHLQGVDHFLSETHRILKPEGHVILKTPNRLDLMRIVFPLLLRRPWYADIDKTHIRYYDKFNIRPVMKRNGFKKIKTYTGTKPLLFKPRIPAIPIVGNGLVVVGEK